MTREEKTLAIQNLREKISENSVMYLADISNLNAQESSDLRRACFKADIKLEVVKNTLLKNAMKDIPGKDFGELSSVLKGNTSIMFSEQASAPAKLIEEFRRKSSRPILKGAYLQESVFIGDDKLRDLASLKSKEEVIADIIGLLQSPTKNVISALQSGKNKLAGIVKTLSER